MNNQTFSQKPCKRHHHVRKLVRMSMVLGSNIMALMFISYVRKLWIFFVQIKI